MPLHADADSGPLCSQCQLASKAAPGSPSKQGGGSAGAKPSTFSTHLEANSTAASVGLTHPHGQTSGEAPLAVARDDLFFLAAKAFASFLVLLLLPSVSLMCFSTL